MKDFSSFLSLTKGLEFGKSKLPGPPFRLFGSRIVFSNWTYVFQGSSLWKDPENGEAGVQGECDADDAYLTPQGFNPKGVRLSLKKAERVGPILHLKNPWDQSGAMGTLMQVDGLYRAWIATGWGDLYILNPNRRPNSAVCYMESTDGFEWVSPKCGTVDFNGCKDHNVVFTTPCFVGGGLTVFYDPAGNPSERYKIAAEWNAWEAETIRRFVKCRPEAVDPRAIREDAKLFLGILGAVSPDGLQWTVLEEPLAVCHCDTQLVGTYNVQREEYVIYTRDYVDPCRDPRGGVYDAAGMVKYARRAIGLTRSKRFHEFSLPTLALQADLSMKPSEVLYTNCYTTIPKAPDHHLMFPAVWDLCHDDETTIHVASSFDGLLWQFVPGGPVLETGNFGQWDGGCVFTHPNLVELPNGDWVLPYTGYDVPHKYPRVHANRHTGYAVWPKGRLISLKADQDGQFETVPIIPPGTSLYINAVTRRAGYILVEVVNSRGEIVHGRSFADSIPLFGDLHWHHVVWKQKDDLGTGRGEAVSLRFQMSHAEIFGIEFR